MSSDVVDRRNNWGRRQADLKLIDNMTDHSKQIADHETRLQLHDQAIKNKEQSIETLKSQVSLVDSHLTNLQREFEVSNQKKIARLDALEMSNKALIEQIKILSDAVNSATTAQHSLAISMSSLAGKMEGKEKEKDTLLSYIKLLLPYVYQLLIGAAVIYYVALDSSIK